MSEFVLHPEAVKDLEEIWEYIALITSMRPTASVKKSMTRSNH